MLRECFCNLWRADFATRACVYPIRVRTDALRSDERGLNESCRASGICEAPGHSWEVLQLLLPEVQG